MLKSYYVSEVHNLEVRGDKIVDTIIAGQDILFNTWCQRGFCRVENGNPVNTLEDALAAIEEYHYENISYHTRPKALSEREAANMYLSGTLGITDVEVSRNDAKLVLHKVINK